MAAYKQPTMRSTVKRNTSNAATSAFQSGKSSVNSASSKKESMYEFMKKKGYSDSEIFDKAETAKRKAVVAAHYAKQAGSTRKADYEGYKAGMKYAIATKEQEEAKRALAAKKTASKRRIG